MKTFYGKAGQKLKDIGVFLKEMQNVIAAGALLWYGGAWANGMTTAVSKSQGDLDRAVQAQVLRDEAQDKVDAALEQRNAKQDEKIDKLLDAVARLQVTVEMLARQR